MYIYISCALHHFRRLPPPLRVGCSGYVICISWSDANGSAFLSSSSVVLLVSCNIYWPYMKLAQINIKNWKVVYAVENVLVIQWWRQNFDPLILTFSYSHSPSHPPLHTLPYLLPLHPLLHPPLLSFLPFLLSGGVSQLDPRGCGCCMSFKRARDHRAKRERPLPDSCVQPKMNTHTDYTWC